MESARNGLRHTSGTLSGLLPHLRLRTNLRLLCRWPRADVAIEIKALICRRRDTRLWLWLWLWLRTADGRGTCNGLWSSRAAAVIALREYNAWQRHEQQGCDEALHLTASKRPVALMYVPRAVCKKTTTDCGSTTWLECSR